MLRVHVNLRLRVSLYKQWGLVMSKTAIMRLIADKYNVVTCESVACRSYFTNKSFRAVCALRDLWYVCACVYESSEASAYSFGLATNPNPTRARSYPLNINPGSRPLTWVHHYARLQWTRYSMFLCHDWLDLKMKLVALHSANHLKIHCALKSMCNTITTKVLYKLCINGLVKYVVIF